MDAEESDIAGVFQFQKHVQAVDCFSCDLTSQSLYKQCNYIKCLRRETKTSHHANCRESDAHRRPTDTDWAYESRATLANPARALETGPCTPWHRTECNLSHHTSAYTSCLRRINNKIEISHQNSHTKATQLPALRMEWSTVCWNSSNPFWILLKALEKADATPSLLAVL